MSAATNGNATGGGGVLGDSNGVMNNANNTHYHNKSQGVTLTWPQVKALCDTDTSCHIKGDWPRIDTARQTLKDFYYRKALWILEGITEPGWAACYEGQGISRDIIREWFRPKPDVNLIIQRCPQMALVRALGGDVSEPYWWASLSITEHAEPNLSRECSDKYPEFRESELDYRIRRIREEQIKPALCSRFDDVNRGICPGCRFYGVIRSPIALGFEREPKGGRS